MHIQQEIYFSISTKDRPGELARITAKLMRAKVSMEGFWGFGIGRGAADVVAIPTNPKEFKEVAKKSKWRVHEGHCFRIEGRDKTGALVDILEKLASEGVNLHVVDALAVKDQFACYLWGREEDAVTIAQVLGLRSPLA